MGKEKLIYRFRVEMPTPQDPTICMICLGGPLKLSDKPGYVWLTKLDGEKLLEVPKTRVHPITEAQMGSAIVAEAAFRRAHRESNSGLESN